MNADSQASLAVANAWVRLRGIPDQQVVRLRGVDDAEAMDLAAWRSRLVIPALRELERRGVAGRISCLVWSADLPWRIRTGAELRQVADPPKWLGDSASPTGLSMLWPLVERPHSATAIPPWAHPLANPAFRRITGLPADDPAVAIAAERQGLSALLKAEDWTGAAGLLERLVAAHPASFGLRYDLACCLARLGRGDAAMERLAEAERLGWWNAAHTAHDPDLAALRERPDFQALLGRLRALRFAVQPTVGFRRRGLPPMALGGGPPGTAELDSAWEKQPATAGTQRSPALHRGPLGNAPYCSSQLAVCSGRGLSLAEALAALERSAAADRSRPAGTVRYLVNRDIRSSTRDWAFASAAEALERSGVRAVVEDGVLPRGRDDIAGLAVGSAGFDWAASGCTILPGAICEHLTSLGGVMTHGAGQTPLSVWLRHGAAGSSGTVSEPYSIQAKFPNAFLHLHYARGLSLAEAFLLSVASPYHLLVVGDPLCAPWAADDPWRIEGLPEGTLTPDATWLPRPGPGSTGLLTLVDGREAPASAAGLCPGEHELRTLAALAGPLRSEVRDRRLLRRAGVPQGATASAASAPLDGRLVVTAACPGAARLGLWRDGEELASATGVRADLVLPARSLGLGASTLRLLAQDAAGRALWQTFVPVRVEPPARLPALSGLPPAATGPATAAWPQAGGRREHRFTATGEGLHQLRWNGTRLLRLAVDGQEPRTIDGPGADLLHLAPGPHRLVIELAPGEGSCAIHLGLQGTRPIRPAEWD